MKTTWYEIQWHFGDNYPQMQRIYIADKYDKEARPAMIGRVAALRGQGATVVVAYMTQETLEWA